MKPPANFILFFISSAAGFSTIDSATSSPVEVVELELTFCFLPSSPPVRVHLSGQLWTAATNPTTPVCNAPLSPPYLSPPLRNTKILPFDPPPLDCSPAGTPQLLPNPFRPKQRERLTEWMEWSSELRSGGGGGKRTPPLCARRHQTHCRNTHLWRKMCASAPPHIKKRVRGRRENLVLPPSLSACVVVSSSKALLLLLSSFVFVFFHLLKSY